MQGGKFMAAYTDTHGKRIKQELQSAGVTALGLLKFSNRYLPKIIGNDEHIQAVAYGRYRVGEGTKQWGWEEGSLVATDARVLFVDRKPGFLRADDIPYSAVSGVHTLTAWPFSAVTLLSKVGTFSLRYVKMGNAAKFADYVESRSSG